MYCKFIKLTNGEDIIVQTDDICDTFKNKEFISVIDPVLISSMRRAHGNMIVESYIMQPWIKMGKMDLVQLATKNIIVAVNIHEVAEKQYMEFIEGNNIRNTAKGDTNFVDESDHETFESLMETLDNNSDEEEEDEHTSKRSGRTFH